MKRDTLILIGAAVVVVAIGVIALASRGGSLASSVSPSVADDQSAGSGISFTKLVQGTQSAIDTRVNYVITSPAQMSELWDMIVATGTPPAVDFKTHSVIAVFAGKEASTAISVAKIEDTSVERMVSIVLANPDTSCSQKLPAVSPYEIITVLATQLPLAHTDVLMKADCSK